jgi:hypothetical protein
MILFVGPVFWRAMLVLVGFWCAASGELELFELDTIYQVK